MPKDRMLMAGEVARQVGWHLPWRYGVETFGPAADPVVMVHEDGRELFRGSISDALCLAELLRVARSECWRDVRQQFEAAGTLQSFDVTDDACRRRQ